MVSSAEAFYELVTGIRVVLSGGFDKIVSLVYISAHYSYCRFYERLNGLDLDTALKQ